MCVYVYVHVCAHVCTMRFLNSCEIDWQESQAVKILAASLTTPVPSPEPTR